MTDNILNFLLIVAALAVGYGPSSCASAAVDPAIVAKLASASVPFVPNNGQWDSRAAFAAQTFAGTLFVTTEGKLVYSLPGNPVAGNAVEIAPIGNPGRRHDH